MNDQSADWECRLADVLQWTSGTCVNAAELGEAKTRDLRLSGVNRLGAAGPGEIAFFFSRHYESELSTARPSVLITAAPFVDALKRAELPGLTECAMVVCRDPALAMAQVLEHATAAKVPSTLLPQSNSAPAVIHPSAVVDVSASLGRGVRIGPLCVVGAGAIIGEGTELVAQVNVGPRVQIGRASKLYPFVSIYEACTIGDRVRIHAGTVIGADGFGYVQQRDANQQIEHRKIYHAGSVVIEDDVEIGANTCVDRATVGETRIGRGSKIDNEVQIGHNVQIGEGSIICGKAGLAGSSSVGRYAYIGGGVGLSNQVHVGDGARIGGMTLISKDIPPGQTWVGNPARLERDHFRVHALLNKLVRERRNRS